MARRSHRFPRARLSRRKLGFAVHARLCGQPRGHGRIQPSGCDTANDRFRYGARADGASNRGPGPDAAIGGRIPQPCSSPSRTAADAEPPRRLTAIRRLAYREYLPQWCKRNRRGRSSLAACRPAASNRQCLEAPPATATRATRRWCYHHLPSLCSQSPGPVRIPRPRKIHL